MTTGAWILADSAERLEAVASWVILPDFASVNVSEEGAWELAAALAERGIVVEAGVWDAADARAVVASPMPGCGWLLLEPMDDEPAAVLATAAAIASALADGGVDLPCVLHGMGTAAWPVLDDAVRRGWGTRIGLEDTLELPDGTVAPDNAALVSAAAARGAGRRS